MCTVGKLITLAIPASSQSVNCVVRHRKFLPATGYQSTEVMARSPFYLPLHHLLHAGWFFPLLA